MGVLAGCAGELPGKADLYMIINSCCLLQILKKQQKKRGEQCHLFFEIISN